MRDSIKLIPHLRDQFDRIVLLNRADAAGSTRAGVDLGVLSQQLQDLDRISLYRADNLQKIFPRSGGRPVVFPPQVQVQYPVAIAIEAVLRIIRTLSGIQGYQLASTPGFMTVDMQSADVAALMYGAQVPTSLGTLVFTSGDRSRDESTNLSFEARTAEIHRISPPAMLSTGNLLGHEASSSPHSSSGNEFCPTLPPPPPETVCSRQ